MTRARTLISRATILGCAVLMVLSLPVPAHAEYLGRYSKNRYQSDSTSNPYGTYGSQYPNGVNNQYGPNGSPYSPQGAQNQYTTGGPKLFGNDGQALGTLNANRYDRNSVSNPYGKYGNQYSPTSVNNPYGKYGSQYSNQSANNPYATQAPIIVSDN